ncbi:GDP-mannose 4,6-dehydratase [bacterium AH-315-P15]|nr:GDP-mannose 4,6-dehydratase [bacterium AH-315-P15]
MTSPKCALIFGVSGQDGGYLAKLLLEKGYEVHGSSRDSEINNFHRLKALDVFRNVTLHSVSTHDFRSILNVVSKIQPAEIYNLAGQSSVGLSFRQPIETMESIIGGTVNILEVIRSLNLETKFYNASSGECFGNVELGAANETQAFRPKSPYGVAKSAAHWAVANYRESYGLFACSGILFNHESPLRPSRFVTAKIVRAAADIAENKSERLELGDLSVERDWGWAPEYVDAMWRILQQSEPDDFVIASGRAHSLEEFVSRVFAKFGLDWNSHVICRPDLKRPSDIKRSVGNPLKAKTLLEWQVKTDFDQTITLLVEGERSRRRKQNFA